MKKTSRRSFQKKTLAVSGGVALFNIGKAGPSPNSKVNVAMIGAGGIASMAYGGTMEENLVALCDVDSAQFGSTKRDHPDLDKARRFTDFRVMLDKMGKEIDMVCVNTPDHTHFAATMAAMERGIHVFTQKPLTHNIWEARTLLKAKKKYRVLTNMGNQGHTYDGIRQLKEWYDHGIFGQITEAHSFIEGPDWRGPYFRRPQHLPPKKESLPVHLDWDLWQGPTGPVDYNSIYHPRFWRGFNRYGTGTFGDWFCHVADAPVWLLDLYEPVVIEAEEVTGGNEWMVADGCRVRFDFRHRGSMEPCTFYWYNGDPKLFQPEPPKDWSWPGKAPGRGTFYYGTRNNGYTDHRSNKPRLADKEKQRAFKEAGYPAEKFPRIKGGPILELVNAVKGGPEPGANFDYAARLTEVMLLGIIAVNHGGRIEWNAENMLITNRPELNRYLKETVRDESWSYGEDLWKG
jgi:predicted dehydrogenase